MIRAFAVKVLLAWAILAGIAHTSDAVDYQVIVNGDGSSDVYACEEDSPAPCVWDCTRDGNRICGNLTLNGGVN